MRRVMTWKETEREPNFLLPDEKGGGESPGRDKIFAKTCADWVPGRVWSTAASKSCSEKVAERRGHVDELISHLSRSEQICSDIIRPPPFYSVHDADVCVAFVRTGAQLHVLSRASFRAHLHSLWFQGQGFFSPLLSRQWPCLLGVKKISWIFSPLPLISSIKWSLITK